MKYSALGLYVIAVYGGIRGLYNGKSWMKAMRLFQSEAAALLQRFLSIRQKAFDGIEQYSKQLIYIQLLHTRWIILLMPTLLIHQFEPAEWEGEVQLKQLKMK